jgi:hypothetical protein
MTLSTQTKALDLRTEFPRSPNDFFGDYVILARTIDKCRADLAGTAGEYHWNCGLAKMFFTFKGIDPMAFQEQLKATPSDEAMLQWVQQTGIPRTPEEILAWSYESRWQAPDTVEMRAYVEETLRKIGKKALYVQSFFQMLDMEEHRI